MLGITHISVGEGLAIVLGGDETAAAYYGPSDGHHYLLRWLYAPSETALLDHFHNVGRHLPTEHETGFNHPGGTMVLMAAADIPGKWLVQPSSFVLPKGKYRVLTSHSETDQTYCIVHELRPQ
jgi:hypothetical protein